MVARSARIHRLPLNKRLDYTLIPAPLDLSLPAAYDEKSVPSIIVTPSSPTHENEFFLAFLSPPPPPPSKVRRAFTRMTTFRSNAPQLPPSPTVASNPKPKGGVMLRWRTVFMLMMLFFILIAHVLTHGLAARRPRLFMNRHTASASVPSEIVAFNGPQTGEVSEDADTTAHGLRKIFNLQWFIQGEEVEARDFIVEALGPAARR